MTKTKDNNIKTKPETPAEEVARRSGTTVPSGEAMAKELAAATTKIDSKVASSQTVASEFKPVVRMFKGDKINTYVSCKHQYRVARTNGKRDAMSIKDCAKVFDLNEIEAEDLLGGKFAIELDEKALTLEYNYTPKKKD